MIAIRESDRPADPGAATATATKECSAGNAAELPVGPDAIVSSTHLAHDLLGDQTTGDHIRVPNRVPNSAILTCGNWNQTPSTAPI